MNEPRECPGCRVELPVTDWPGGSPKANASPECQQVAGELLGFEVENAARLGYLHQLRIDAYGAQHAGEHTPAIGTIFALNGLYMFLERGSDNLDIRTAHGIMANSGTRWPRLLPPDRVGRLTAYDVLQGGSVEAVEKLLLAWAEQVWSGWPANDQQTVRQLTIELVPPRYLKR